MVKVNKLKGKMVEKGINAEALAKMSGCARSTIYRKFNDPESITIRDANIFCEALGLTSDEAAAIFFSQCVAPRATRGRDFE